MVADMLLRRIATPVTAPSSLQHRAHRHLLRAPRQTHAARASAAAAAVARQPMSAGRVVWRTMQLHVHAGTKHCMQRWSMRASATGTSATTPDVASLKAQLSAMEAERDEALASAESCAESAVKLTEMVSMLGELAMRRVQDGDEDAAKEVLVEKASANEAMEKMSAKATANYELAAKLAQKIGELQKALLAAGAPEALTQPASVGERAQTMPAAAAPPAAEATPAAPGTDAAAPGPPASQGGASAAAAAGDATTAAAEAAAAAPTSVSSPSPAPSPSVDGAASPDAANRGASDEDAAEEARWQARRAPAKAKWEESLEQARARVARESAAAQGAGMGARLGAEASIAAARERLRAKAADDILAARARVTAAGGGAEESIRAAQERLRAQEAEVMQYVNRIMARYRRGEQVSEEELEFAFTQLERHFKN